jgi:hypothetical protein
MEHCEIVNPSCFCPLFFLFSPLTKTPLSAAQKNVAMQLLTFGADLYAKNARGETALDKAKTLDLRNMVEGKAVNCYFFLPKFLISDPTVCSILQAQSKTEIKETVRRSGQGKTPSHPDEGRRLDCNTSFVQTFHRNIGSSCSFDSQTEKGNGCEKGSAEQRTRGENGETAQAGGRTPP